jgi:hypothetical protein
MPWVKEESNVRISLKETHLRICFGAVERTHFGADEAINRKKTQLILRPELSPNEPISSPPLRPSGAGGLAACQLIAGGVGDLVTGESVDPLCSPIPDS